MPTVFERCFAFLMVHEVGADPLDPKCWTGEAVGAGTFVAHNDGLDLNQSDTGNWTGGAVGAGSLGGTRWGIDSASYKTACGKLPPVLVTRFPALVRDLTLDQARDLTLWAYWKPIRGDALPPQLAHLTLDAAFNNGPAQAVRWLQEAVGSQADGVIGDVTMADVQKALKQGGLDTICSEVLARRIDTMARLPTWRLFGLGWARRLALLPFQASELPLV